MAPGADTARVVALLFASYPTVAVDAAGRSAYAAMLADLAPDELEDAVMSAVATRPRLPSIAELRSLCLERRLGLPSPIVAYELALRWSSTPSATRCPTCLGDGTVEVDGADAVQVEVPDTIQDPDLRAQLERVAAAGALRPRQVCSTCGGDGNVPNPARAGMPEAVRRALYAVGGPTALNDPENPETLRAQFLKAYESLRGSEVEQASLSSAGLELTRRDLPALEEGER